MQESARIAEISTKVRGLLFIGQLCIKCYITGERKATIQSSIFCRAT